MTNWDLIAKHLAGETSQEEAKEFERWLASDKSNEEIVKTLKLAVRPGKSTEDFSRHMEEDWMAIQQKIETSGKAEVKAKQVYLFSAYRVAASLLLLVVAGYGVWYFTRSVNKAQQLFSSADSVKNITLPDGSRVWLNKFSKLKIDSRFGEKTRSVTLEGEGYFQVAKDKRKPFLISTGNIITQVVGTAFNINQDKSGSTKVVVEEGKVLVKSTETAQVYLIPGEAAVYSEKNNSLTKEQNRDLNFMTWKTGVIRFDNELLKNVCVYLSQYYHADIRLEDAQLENRTISTVLDNTDLQNALSIVSLTLNLKIEHTGRVYYLKVNK